MKDSGNKPLVSILVIAYKQEAYIREAVRSALAQTYQPLEVILSDDCSGDATYAIMEEEVRAYTGPHSVRLNQNSSNSGFAAHLNRMFSMARGELFVVQAGDDRSLPERTTRLVDAWLAEGRPDMLVSGLRVIDSNGVCIRPAWGGDLIKPTDFRDVIRTEYCSSIGCACAYSRTLFDTYGPMPDEALQEDNILPFRAMLGAGVKVVPECLVEYRSHGENMNLGVRKRGRLPRSQEKKWAKNRAAITKDWIRSLEKSGKSEPGYRTALGRLLARNLLVLECFEASRLGAAWHLLRAPVLGFSARAILRLLREHVIRR